MDTDIGEIALHMMFFRDQLKIYHWQTKSYSRHIASDSLVNSISEKMDSFIEVIQGSRGKRLSVPNNRCNLKNFTDSNITRLLKDFKEWLIIDLMEYLKDTDTDLINIRDDILADINKCLYLFTLE